jgi:hypothetical protein
MAVHFGGLKTILQNNTFLTGTSDEDNLQTGVTVTTLTNCY